MDGWMAGWMDGQVACTSELAMTSKTNIIIGKNKGFPTTPRTLKPKHVSTKGVSKLNGWMDGWMDGWIKDGPMDG